MASNGRRSVYSESNAENYRLGVDRIPRGRTSCWRSGEGGRIPFVGTFITPAKLWLCISPRPAGPVLLPEQELTIVSPSPYPLAPPFQGLDARADASGPLCCDPVAVRDSSRIWPSVCQRPSPRLAAHLHFKEALRRSRDKLLSRQRDEVQFTSWEADERARCTRGSLAVLPRSRRGHGGLGYAARAASGTACGRGFFPALPAPTRALMRPT